MPADRLLHSKLLHSRRVSILSDLEFRTWVTYELASDDYGVMRFSALAFQAANDALEKRRAKDVTAALEKLVAIDLLKTFEHQGALFCYQETWQNFQRVKHPRDTSQPLPPDDAIAACTSSTRKLFAQHPSNRAAELPQDFGKVSEELPQPLSELGSLARARTRETANGLRLTANGYRQTADPLAGPPMDEWARELVNLADPRGRCAAALVERPLFGAISALAPMSPEVAFAFIRERLEAHKASHQWRVKGMVKRLDKWLLEGLYLQELPAEAPPAERVSSRTNTTLAAAAEVIREGR